MKLNSNLVLGASLLGLTALLSACGGGEVIVEPTPATVVTVIAGTLTPWTAGKTGTIASQRLNTTAAVNGSGNFDLGLPNTAAMTTDPKYTPDLTDGSQIFTACTSGSVNVPSGLKFINITGLFVDNANSEYLNYSTYQGGVLSYKGWWFVNNDATVTADTTCLTGVIKANLNLKQGWNIVNYIETSANNTIVTQLSTATPSNDRMSWRPNPLKSTSLGLQRLSRQANPWGVLR